MLTDRTNSTNTKTQTSFNQKKRKEIKPRSWVWLHYASKTHRACELIFNCVTSASVSSENLFSNAGLVQNDQRNRIEPSALNVLNNELSILEKNFDPFNYISQLGSGKFLKLYCKFYLAQVHTIRLEKNSYSPNSENSSLYSYPYSANSLLAELVRGKNLHEFHILKKERDFSQFKEWLVKIR
ncbi:hypothetical protein BpHYR1_049513 [Brachionus plicatilis]|uniref:Uncharacterized protein n=1 Tax=Brachionus plicatilis TaxID=10195 RepID=A0A3M7QZJ1_BRAPC|nr:hypothetical protein BpHYR1_049513 [Brachionus plicatilis]